MPYVLDLVRLATSALLGQDEHTEQAVTASEICTAILKGYRQGLAAPQPIVLDRDHMWLRELVVVPDADRTEFWADFAKLEDKPAPARYRKAIEAAMPVPKLVITTARRSAGAGSLGRPRWVGLADWRGAPVIREAKALVVSAWDRAHRRKAAKIRVAELIDGRFRAIDPWNRIDGQLVMRRLSPNNRKLEAETNQAAFFTSDMLHMMGFELANVHLAKVKRGVAICGDLDKRKRGWLAASARTATAAVAQDFKDWKAG